MNAEISTYMGNEITTIRVSQLLYQNMTDKKTTVNRRSKTEVSAWPVRKWRMFSSSRTRAMVSPTLRDSKYAKGVLIDGGISERPVQHQFCWWYVRRHGCVVR